MKKYILAASMIFLALDIHSDEKNWKDHYKNGMHFYKNRLYKKADWSFTHAVKLIQKEKNESHIFIRIDRAKNYLKLEKFYNALEDVNLVIDCPTLSKKHLITALKVRMHAYKSLDMNWRSNEDWIWYKSLVRQK